MKEYVIISKSNPYGIRKGETIHINYKSLDIDEDFIVTEIVELENGLELTLERLKEVES